MNDSHERPVSITHQLQLYAKNSSGKTPLVEGMPIVPVVSETYDELIFNEPCMEMFTVLTQRPYASLDAPEPHPTFSLLFLS